MREPLNSPLRSLAASSSLLCTDHSNLIITSYGEPEYYFTIDSEGVFCC